MSGPSELLQVGLDPAQFHKAGANEFRGPCPFCGGHDRFRVHTERPFPHWNAVCREGSGCNFKGWVDEINPRLREPLTAERAAMYAANAKAEAERAAQSLAQRLKEFSDGELWAELNRRMSERNRAWWASQGIDEHWQDFWQLGYTSATQWGEAYTIPFFSAGWEAVNMQYRLCHPPEVGNKYRWAGLGYSSHFTANPGAPPTDKVVICEGAKKAMVYFSRFGAEAVQVYAIPSKADSAGVVSKAQQCGRAWVVLDPDATTNAEKLAREIGPHARVVDMTEKLDDAITIYGAGKRELGAFFRQARKVD